MLLGSVSIFLYQVVPFVHLRHFVHVVCGRGLHDRHCRRRIVQHRILVGGNRILERRSGKTGSSGSHCSRSWDVVLLLAFYRQILAVEESSFCDNRSATLRRSENDRSTTTLRRRRTWRNSTDEKWRWSLTITNYLRRKEFSNNNHHLISEISELKK